MRRMKIAGAALMAVVALSAIASATAGAAAPTILPGSGTFTSTSGLGTLETSEGSQIICKTDKNVGTVLGAQAIDVTVDFEGCTAFGLPANSLGDKEGIILVVLAGNACYIKKATPTEAGLELAVQPAAGIHLEVPSAGVLLVIKGSVVGSFTPINGGTKTGPFTLAFTKGAGKGVQAITKCEGGPTLSLLTATSEGAFLGSVEATSDSVTLAATHEIMT